MNDKIEPKVPMTVDKLFQDAAGKLKESKIKSLRDKVSEQVKKEADAYQIYLNEKRSTAAMKEELSQELKDLNEAV